MKILIPIIIVVVIAVVVVIVRRKLGGSATANQTLTLEQKLEVLSTCGLRLSAPFKPEDLLTSWGREEFEEPGFDLVLIGLGMTEEQRPWRNHCVNLWHFDTECIEDHGDYKQIVERMVQMAQGSLPLENIKDHVDLEKEEAWFSFTFHGRETKVDCKVEDDWVDSTIFAKFVDLLNRSDPTKIYVYFDLGGQDCIIGCVTKEELGSAAKDRKEEAETVSAQGVSMVQEASPRPRKGAVAEPEPEIAWALRVLWDYIQHAESEQVL